ncbi:MAG TPA: hypothetical protein VIA06_21545 [Candidatus Dormibacteraeota bacterium]|jgi:hypothetical protein|nr:hypothetical protein [Candidatus Dormibacteraeota bacterium]
MDVQTIDREYQQLQNQARETTRVLQALAARLTQAAQSGDQNAREWQLDLREVALAIQSEQSQVQNLLQALHGFVANQAQQSGYGQPGFGGPLGQGGGYGVGQGAGLMGALGGFMNSGFGRAIEMGAGFGIGDDLINRIF